MSNYNKITALYSRLSVGDEDRDGGESNSIQNQKIFLENYAKGQHLTNIRHYIDDDESGRFFDRSAYSRMIEDVESGKIGVCIMKDLTRWGRDYLQVGNAMEIFRRNNVRFIAVNNGIDSENPDTLEFAPFINIMSEWYAKDISKKVKTGIKTKGMSGKPIATEAPYGYIKAPDNKDFWIIDEEAAEVVRLIFRLFLDGKNRNQIAVYLTQEQIPTPTFYMKDRGRGTCKNKTLNEDNRYKWNKATLTHILTRQEYCGDVVNFKTTKHFRDKRNHYVDRSQWHITENVHEPIIDRTDFENVQRILENAPVKRPNGDGEIHPLSGLLFCKDCGAKMHIRIDYRNGGKRHVAYCSEYHKAIIQNGARLIILDPIQAYMGDKADMNKANEVRPIFRRLAEVAERTGCAVILIGHLNKAAGGQSAYRGLGSIDFRAAARSVLLIGRVKREPNVRVIIHDKSSLAPEGKPVAFCLDPETGFEWIGEYDITADELLSGAGGNNATKTEQAEKLILDLLADGKELASEDIEKAAADAGISARTVRAAKKNLDGRITSKRIGAAWYHALKK